MIYFYIEDHFVAPIPFIGILVYIILNTKFNHVQKESPHDTVGHLVVL